MPFSEYFWSSLIFDNSYWCAKFLQVNCLDFEMKMGIENCIKFHSCLFCKQRKTECMQTEQKAGEATEGGCHAGRR